MAKRLTKNAWDTHIDELMHVLNTATDWPDDQPDDYGGSSGDNYKPIADLTTRLKALWGK